VARFYGKVGYGVAVETPEGSGIWVDQIIELPYKGDVVRLSRNLVDAQQQNDNITLGSSISIVADQYAYSNFAFIKYVEYLGVLWKASTVEVQTPRIIITLGGVYNGPQD